MNSCSLNSQAEYAFRDYFGRKNIVSSCEAINWALWSVLMTGYALDLAECLDL